VITAIVVLCLLAIKDDILDIVDLFSTLQGRSVIVGVVTLISTVTGILEIRFISVFEGTWAECIWIAIVVGVVDGFTAGLLVHYKKHIKKYLRKKKLQKNMAVARQSRWKGDTDAKNKDISYHI